MGVHFSVMPSWYLVGKRHWLLTESAIQFNYNCLKAPQSYLAVDHASLCTVYLFLCCQLRCVNFSLLRFDIAAQIVLFCQVV